jgi:processive 1,2-diacylglycerol beta-glucosyltransferase
MIHLHDIEANQSLGTISEEQLQFLIDQLEEESSEDQDYYLSGDTLLHFEEVGGDPQLIAVLRAGLGAREGMEIRWARS